MDTQNLTEITIFNMDTQNLTEIIERLVKFGGCVVIYVLKILKYNILKMVINESGK